MDPRVIVTILLVFVLSDLTFADQECPANTLPENVIEVVECSGTCFEVVKPIISHIRELKATADKSHEYKNQMIELLKEVEIKDQLIHTLNATIKIKDEQIQTLNALIKSHDDQKGTISALIRSNEALIRSNEALTKAQSENEELISLKNNVNSLKQQIDEKNKELKKNSEVKAVMNEKLNSCLDNIDNNNSTLIEKEREIRENKEEIKRKDELLKKQDKKIQEKTDEAKTKDAQNRDLASKINVISQNLIKANETILKCDKSNYCPLVGKAIHHIKLPGVSAFEAPCNGSGWMVIQRRIDGSVDFNRTWNEYRDGFGNLTGEFFIGLEKLHQITKSRQQQLFIRLGKVDGSRDFVMYDDFRIGSEENSFPLESVGKHTGGAGDSLKKYHLKMKFSTIDRDNDFSEKNCAKAAGGGWWYHNCSQSCLNGGFQKDGKKHNKRSISWGSWYKGDWSISLTFVEMMIRPKSF